MTRRDFTKSVSIAAGAISTLSLTGCDSNKVLGYIEAGIAAGETILSILTPAYGVNPANAQIIAAYLQATFNALSQVSNIVTNGGNAAGIGAQVIAILKNFQQIPFQTQGLNTQLITEINAVEDSVKAILQIFGGAQAVGGATAHTVAPQPVEFGFMARHHIRSAGAKAAEISAKFAKVNSRV